MENELLKTLCYADIFDFPLTISELHRYLISDKPFSRSQIRAALARELPFAEKIGSEYVLTGRGELVAKRHRQTIVIPRKMKRAKHAARLLSCIPFIRFIGVSGSLGANNAKEDDDIDFFIITAKNRLWISRFLAVFLLFLTGVKRSRNSKHVSDFICLNYFLSEDNLFFQNRNLFIAHEIVQTKPLFERGNCYERFLSQNRWVLSFLPNAFFGIPSPKSLQRNPPQNWYRMQILRPVDKLLSGLDYLLFHIQRGYMARHQTSEVVGRDIAKFHPQDKKQPILSRYRNRLGQIRKTKRHSDPFRVIPSVAEDYSRILTW